MLFLWFLTFYSDPASACCVAYSQILGISLYLINAEGAVAQPLFYWKKMFVCNFIGEKNAGLDHKTKVTDCENPLICMIWCTREKERRKEIIHFSNDLLLKVANSRINFNFPPTHYHKINGLWRFFLWFRGDRKETKLLVRFSHL